ncbi:MAG: hypothetical protein RLY31_541 [Bacteroidota bacterium]|jgi:outer membrane protein TolC
MMSKRKHLVFLVAVSLLPTIRLSSQQALDLRGALQYAAEHHAQVRKGAVDIQIAEQLIRESLSTGLPQVNANASIANNLSIRTSFVPAEFFGGQPGEFAQVQFGTNWNASSGIQLDQLAFSKTWFLGLRASRELTRFYALLHERQLETVLYEVAKLYYQIQYSRNQRALITANLSQLKGMVTLMERQVSAGFAKQLDLDRLQVQFANLEMELTNLDLQLEQAEQALKFSMQMPLDTEITLTDTLGPEPLPFVEQLVSQPGWSASTQLRILQKQQQLNELDELRWKANYFPTLSFFASYTYEWQANNLSEFTSGRNWTDFSQVGLRLQVPLFDGMYKDSKLQAARLNARKTDLDYSLAALGAELQHQSAITAIRRSRNSRLSAEKNRGLAERVYRVAQSRYVEGLASVTELLDAENSLRQAQANQLSVLAQTKLAEIDLINANGMISKLME